MSLNLPLKLVLQLGHRLMEGLKVEFLLLVVASTSRISERVNELLIRQAILVINKYLVKLLLPLMFLMIITTILGTESWASRGWQIPLQIRLGISLSLSDSEVGRT